MPVDKPGCGVSSLRLIPKSFRDQDEASRESITRPRLSRPLLRSPETQPPALSSPKSYPSKTKQETPSRQTRDCTSRTRCRAVPDAPGRPPTPSLRLRTIQNRCRKPEKGSRARSFGSQKQSRRKLPHTRSTQKQSNACVPNGRKDRRRTTNSTPCCHDAPPIATAPSPPTRPTPSRAGSKNCRTNSRA